MPRGKRKSLYWTSDDKKWHTGMSVAVEQKDNFRGRKLGLIVGPCPKKDGGITVYLVEEGFPNPYICVILDRGDLMLPLTLNNPNLTNPES